MDPARRRFVTVRRAASRNPLTLVMGAVTLLYIGVALTAPWISPHDPAAMHFRDRFQAPSLTYPMGTDESGRDILSRVIHGTRVTVAVGFGSVAIAALAGTALGLLAGFRGGIVDHLIMRVFDGLLAFPSLILAMTLVAVFGPTAGNLILAIGIFLTPPMARIVRSAVLAQREREYVHAARLLGAGDRYVAFRVILPNCLSSIIVQTSLSVAIAIKVEAFLSFLGMGTQIPDASWGLLLANGYQFLNRAWWYSIFPAVNILVIVLALNLVGDGLRDWMEPRLRHRA
jgi:peptide/nickel transport system permease protein